MQFLGSLITFVFSVLLVGVVGFTVVCVLVNIGVLQQKPPRPKRYSPENDLYWKNYSIEQSVTTDSVAGFKVPYTLALWLERINDEEFEKSQMLEQHAHESLVKMFNRRHFERFLAERGWFFAIELCKGYRREFEYNIAWPVLYAYDRSAEFGLRRVLQTQVLDGVTSLPVFEKNGCSVALTMFNKNSLDAKLVKENYAMLTEEEKAAIESTVEFAKFQSQLAIAMIRREQELLEGKEQIYRSDDYYIETEIASRGVKIRWVFSSPNESASELLGFRKAGGFSADQWSSSSNGTLVVHSSTCGEITEFLPEKEPQFYTFFLKRTDRDGKSWKRGSVRFQIRVPGKDELNELVELATRVEKKPEEEVNEGVAKSLKELNLVMEFHEEIDKMERSFIDRIKGKGLSPEEEEEKIDFVRDVVRLQREKYEPQP